MNILLVSPGISPDSQTPGGLMIPQLSLHILEGLTPPQHTVKIVEEENERLDLDEPCDLVGISCMTSNAPRAYLLAAEFRKRGRKVVLGGVHPTILPDEALLHADAVVVGEAEGVWDRVVADCENGAMKGIYQAPPWTFDRYIPMKYRKNSKRRLFNVVPVMTTRGCPYSCDFCCVSDLYGKKIRHAPVANVVRDIVESENKIYIFLDDNIIGEPNYAKALFRAIAPLNITWVGQASISFVHDAELMDLAAKSGCAALFVGIESVSTAQVKKMRKSIKKADKLEEAVRRIKGLGIHLHASFVFGFDGDTPSVFPETLEFLQKNRISSASFNILTPYPGTAVYRQFKAEGRLLTDDWKYYDHSTVVFKPRNMTPYELQAGEIWVKKEFSRLPNIVKYLPWNMSHPLLYLAINLGTRHNAKVDLKRLPELSAELFERPAQEIPIAQPALLTGT
jgi:radical SAM superfamily enzyme YgiQ (UPF0313 family)